MTEDIDHLIAATPDTPSLATLEADVWQRVERRQRQRQQVQVRFAALAVALTVGVTNGGVVALSARPQHTEMQVFSVSAALAPIGLGFVD